MSYQTVELVHLTGTLCGRPMADFHVVICDGEMVDAFQLLRTEEGEVAPVFLDLFEVRNAFTLYEMSNLKSETYYYSAKNQTKIEVEELESWTNGDFAEEITFGKEEVQAENMDIKLENVATKETAATGDVFVTTAVVVYKK